MDVVSPLPSRPPGTQLRARRNPRWIVIGLMAMALGGLGAGALYAQAADVQSVLVAGRTIPRGEVIQASDLKVVDVQGTAGLRTVGQERLGEIAGTVAVVDVAEGSLVTPQSFGRAAVAAGTVQIGLRLAPGRIPVREMPAGTPVRLIGVAAKTTGAPDAEPAGAPFVVGAVIATAPRATADQAAFVLDVAVAADAATTVAQLAAADRIVLIREAE